MPTSELHAAKGAFLFEACHELWSSYRRTSRGPRFRLEFRPCTRQLPANFVPNALTDRHVMTLIHDDRQCRLYSYVWMCSRRISATWLSDEMAHALAAMCPPLQTADVLRAADRLTEHAEAPEVIVVDAMFRSDVDRVSVRNVVEALRALHDVA